MPAARNSRRSKQAPESACMAVFRFDSPNSETVQSVAFAPNVTPTTFENPPSSTEKASIADDSLSPASHNKKKSKDHIPRPPNAFILFRSDFVKGKRVPSNVETDHSNLSKVIGHTWRIMSDDERAIWYERAKEQQEKHRKQHPDYCYVPVHKKHSEVAKRKVKECGFRDEKRCRAIAELVTAGKKGEELAAALREFDRHHVPEIITRFDTPITVSTFKQASPATEAAQSSKKPKSPRPSARALSKQPSSLSSAPSSPSSRQSSPATLSDFDFDNASFLESSPSPVEPETITYPLPLPNASFTFDTFTFETPASSPYQSSYGSADGGFDSPFDILSQMSYSSQDEYDSTYLSVDTANLDHWTASSSPFSSAPSTPHSFAEDSASDHLVPELEYLPSHPNVFEASTFEFVPPDASHVDSACQLASADVDVFGTPVKHGYNLHGLEVDFSYQLLTSNVTAGEFAFLQPTFAM